MRPTTALQQHWDSVLKAESLQVLEPGFQTSGRQLNRSVFPSLYDVGPNGSEYCLADYGALYDRDDSSDAWTSITIWDTPTAVANEGRAEAMEALIPRMPSDWQDRFAFYRLWASTGYLKKSAGALGLNASTASGWLTELRDFFCPNRPKTNNSNGKRKSSTGGVYYYRSRSHLHDPWVARPGKTYLGAFETEELACAAVARWRATQPPKPKKVKAPKPVKPPKAPKPVKPPIDVQAAIAAAEALISRLPSHWSYRFEAFRWRAANSATWVSTARHFGLPISTVENWAAGAKRFAARDSI